MEVTRGCIWACRFCTAGFIYRPPRLPDLNLTYHSMERVLAGQGKSASTVGLVGPSVTDHPDLLPLARKIVEDGKMLSFSSLRMETLTDELVDLIQKSGQKTLTVAVDGHRSPGVLAEFGPMDRLGSPWVVGQPLLILAFQINVNILIFEATLQRGVILQLVFPPKVDHGDNNLRLELSTFLYLQDF